MSRWKPPKRAIRRVETHDAATLAFEGRLAVTTDAFTVSPLFFPGGDLGSLAVHGTVNDLACAGAEPLAMTVAFVLEEGLELSVLSKLVRSLADAARTGRPSDLGVIGIAVFRAADEAEALAIMQGDPAVRDGVMSAELFPFRIALESLSTSP